MEGRSMIGKLGWFLNKKPTEERDDIIDLVGNSKDTITQCMIDWRRGADTIFFIENGKEKSLRAVFKEVGVVYGDSGFELTVEQLTEIWYEHILQKAFGDNQQQKQKMFVHLSELDHSLYI